MMKEENNLKKHLEEDIRLGLYEPEAMNVDLADIRKGVMPEYPKKPPAEMIDGYHQDSKLKPKELRDKYLLKIDEKDLLRNHKLKRSEVDEIMNTVKMINDHLKKHPEDLIYAQQRYPIDDPRLAELNWKMDQMLEAGEEYLDSNFKENQTLYKRATDRTKKNIKLTDPEYVQQHYDELRGTTKPKKTKLVGRLGKHLNKYESKSLFRHVNSKDFKKISERKLEKEKFLKKQEQERLDYINDINAEMDEFRSDWRNELKEQPAFKAVPIDTAKMTSSQSFAIFPNFPGSSDTGIRLDLDGGLGRDNSLASTDLGLGDPNFTGIFQFPSEGGGFVPAISFKAGGEINSAQISYGDFPLSGYAMPLGGKMSRSINQKKSEEINKELESSEEFTKKIEADALMKARVDSNIMTGNNLQDITTSFENVKVPFDQGKFSSYMRTNIEQFQTLGAYESEIEILENKIRKISYRHPIQITNRVATGDTEEARNKNYAKMEQFEKQIKQIKEKQRKIPADPKYPKTKISQAQFDALLKEISPADYIEGEEILKNNFLGQLEKQKKELNKKIDSLMKKYPQFNGDPERILGKWNGSVQIPIFDSDNNEIKPPEAAIGKQLEMIRLKKNIFNRMIYDSFDPSSVTYTMPPTVSDTSEPSPTEPTTELTTNKVSQEMDTQGDTLSSDEMNALLSRGFEKDAINDVLSQGGIDSLRDILSGNIEAGFFSDDPTKPLDISKLRSTLYLRYMTGNKKPFTEKNLSKQQLKSLERQVIQNLTTKSLATTNLVSNLGPATKDITGTLNKRQRFALGLDKNDFVYTVSSYTKTPMKDNDLRYLLGNYIVVTTVRNGKRVVKEIRDDFDFKYGYEVDRSDGSFAGDSYTKRKKGGQSVDLGRGIFVGSETGGEDPFKVKAGRTGVNIGAGLGIGSPVPIRIKF